MGITALVMAGGKGSRMALSEEKPLLQVGGKHVIEHVLNALKNSKNVDCVVVAVSDYTPKTAKLLSKLQFSVIKTPGKEYVSDMGYAVKALKLQTVLAIGADFPLITAEVIDDILGYYKRCGKPALSVAVSIETKVKLGLSGKYGFELNGKYLIPAGINVIDGRRINEEELDEEIYLLDRKEVAVNINTVQELQIAEKIFSKLHPQS
ncbi:GTP--adenosylcobinamide-phosphate guanylyltransferase [Candidatus Bathyarchaeota archaeon]|nr:GTP--adenosylcobinamide-phosphate guanylyltransferase [Candidatus Bathyarchaeota archaeon]